jgi:penicillin-binding protein 2
MSVIHAPRRPELDPRLIAFPVITFGLFGVLAMRLWYFQVVKAPELVERAEATRVQPTSRPAPRGIIVDRNGETVAGVRPQLVVTAIYDVVSKKENAWVIDKVAQMLGADIKKLNAKLQDAKRNRSQPMPIYFNAPNDIGARIAESGADLPGISIDTAPMRSYPDAYSYTHLLGYVGLPNQRDLDRLREKGIDAPAEFVGKGGVEQAYEQELMGQAGEDRTETDAKGRAIRQVGRDAPIPGDQLVLTLDAKLQRYTTEMMKERGYTGGVVAIDPRNGEVLTMVSSPTYDLTMFLGGVSQDEWATLQHDPRHPMVKRPLRSAYSPGSTFKIVTSLAAFRKGIFDPNRPAFCAGGYRLGKRFLKCLGYHGSITFDRALAKSCNSYFCDLGYRAGEDAINSAALEFGLGQPVGIDIHGESPGIVPTKEWLAKSFRDPHWYGGDTLNLSIGQGYIAATPLQMAGLAAIVANDGIGYRPHLVRSFKDPMTGKVRIVQPEVSHNVPATPQFWDTIKGALRGVVTSGTARVADVPGMEVAGKTGSTEHGHGKTTHAWFVGFAPVENPKIAVCVLLEGAGHGGEVAAPVAAEVIKKYLSSQKGANGPKGSALVPGP